MKKPALLALLALAAGVPSSVVAEGMIESAAGKSAPNRIYGAATLVEGPDGALYPMVGSRVRRIERKKLGVTVLHTEPKDALEGLAFDGERILAAYEKRALRYFPRRGAPAVAVPHPAAAVERTQFFGALALVPKSERAILYVTEPPDIERAWRVSLDDKTAKPELLHERRHGALLYGSGRAAVYLENAGKVAKGAPPTATQCSPMMCPSDHLSVYEWSALPKAEVVVLPLGFEASHASIVPRVRGGTDPDRAVLLTEARYGQAAGLAVVRFDPPSLAFRDLPGRPAAGGAKLAPDGETSVHLTVDGPWIEVWRCPLPPATASCESVRFDAGTPVPFGPSSGLTKGKGSGADFAKGNAIVPARQARPESFGVLSDGRVWIVNDGEIVLSDRGAGARRVALTTLIPGGPHEWAGEVRSFTEPDELFVGIESGPSRDFVRIPIADVEKASRVFDVTTHWRD